MKKFYRIVPIIGYLIECSKKINICESPVFILYHILTGGLISLFSIILILQ